MRLGLEPDSRAQQDKGVKNPDTMWHASAMLDETQCMGSELTPPGAAQASKLEATKDAPGFKYEMAMPLRDKFHADGRQAS